MTRRNASKNGFTPSLKFEQCSKFITSPLAVEENGVIFYRAGSRRTTATGNKSKFSAGFTLLELLIYISVLTIVLLSVLGILNITNNVRVRQEAKTEVLRNAGFVTERMSRLGKDADSFGTVVTTSAEFIQGGVTTTVYVQNSELRLKKGAGEENLIASVVLAEQVTSTEPIFKKIGNTIQMKLKLRYNDQGNQLYKYSTNVETTVTLR